MRKAYARMKRSYINMVSQQGNFSTLAEVVTLMTARYLHSEGQSVEAEVDNNEPSDEQNGEPSDEQNGEPSDEPTPKRLRLNS